MSRPTLFPSGFSAVIFAESHSHCCWSDLLTLVAFFSPFLRRLTSLYDMFSHLSISRSAGKCLGNNFVLNYLNCLVKDDLTSWEKKKGKLVVSTSEVQTFRVWRYVSANKGQSRNLLLNVLDLLTSEVLLHWERRLTVVGNSLWVFELWR